MNEADNERHMSRVEAVAILMALAKKRSMGVEQVTALQMGAALMLNKHMQRQRNWARRMARAGETAHDPATGTGAFFTPPDVLDAVTANPPMPPPDADMDAPKEADDE